MDGLHPSLKYDSPSGLKKVIKIKIDEVSAKIREGDPVDEKKDYALDVWAGVISITKKFEEPVSDTKLKPGITLSESAKNKLQET